MSAEKILTYTEVRDGGATEVGPYRVLWKRSSVAEGYYWIADSRRDDGASIEVDGDDHWRDYREAVRAARKVATTGVGAPAVKRVSMTVWCLAEDAERVRQLIENEVWGGPIALQSGGTPFLTIDDGDPDEAAKVAAAFKEDEIEHDDK